MSAAQFDAVVVGGGFYGAVIALYLKIQRALPRVLLVEQQPILLARASYGNQARLHNGYHYPRSLRTAYRSRANLPRFLRDWQHACFRDFTKLYAVARQNSKTTARQFERFCAEIGAPCARAGDDLRQLFDRTLVEDVFLTEEYAFDAVRLRDLLGAELTAAAVQVRTATVVTRVDDVEARGERLRVELQHPETAESVEARFVFNCTYSALNAVGGEAHRIATPLKHQIAEIALVDPPDYLRGLSVTVVDGPFFSIMPFPARGLHSLTHVRYTPHVSWNEESHVHPYDMLTNHHAVPRADRMLMDAARYFPAARQYRHVESIFEIKTVLAANEPDDGRPILMEKHPRLNGYFSILGGKIDNVYDVLEKLDAEFSDD